MFATAALHIIHYRSVNRVGEQDSEKEEKGSEWAIDSLDGK